MNDVHEAGGDVVGRALRGTSLRAARTTARFAAAILLLTAAFSILQGIAALADDELLRVEGDDYSYAFDLSAWGWVHVVVGLLSIAVAVGLFTGRTWGLVTGLVVAGASILANFAFLPVYPLWAIAVIGFDVLAVWALCTLLREAEAPPSA